MAEIALIMLLKHVPSSLFETNINNLFTPIVACAKNNVLAKTNVDPDVSNLRRSNLKLLSDCTVLHVNRSSRSNRIGSLVSVA